MAVNLASHKNRALFDELIWQIIKLRTFNQNCANLDNRFNHNVTRRLGGDAGSKQCLARGLLNGKTTPLAGAG